MSKANNKLAQIRVLQKSTDKSLQHLINEAYRILENPIILYDLDWTVLACAENVTTDDPIWNNHISDGTITSNVGIFINEGFTDLMAGPDNVVLLSSERVKCNRFFGKVFDKDNTLIAGVSLVASNKPFDDDDPMLIETICKMLSDEICKDPYYQNYAQLKIETYINMLICGKIKSMKDKLYVSFYVEIIYRGLKEHLYLAIADITQCDPTCAKLHYYRDLFKQIRPAFKYSIYSNYIVIIMSTDEGNFYPKKSFNQLNKLFEQKNIKVGISSRFENLFELPKHYNEAVKALSNGLKGASGQQIFVYDNETP